MDESMIARINLYSWLITPEKIPDTIVKIRTHYDDIFFKTFVFFGT